MLARAALQRSQPRGVDLLAVPRSLVDLANRQDGVLTRSQLGAAGMTCRQVQAAVAARRWRAFGRNVVVLQNAPLTGPQRRWVAVLLPGKPAALAGLSAAAAAGLTGFEPEQVHVVVRHATHVAAPTWVRLHESRRFDLVDINEVAMPPRTRAARSVIDAAAWSRHPRRACAILCAAVQQRLTTVEQLDEQLVIAGRVRHARIMREVLGDIAGGGHTLAEIALAPLARQAGLHPPDRQRLRRDVRGRARYLDAEFDLPDGTVLAVEIDGAGHLQPETWWDDLSRANEQVIERRVMLRFPSLAVRLKSADVVDQLRRIRLAHS
jgi:hypothetical protein